ncbi:mannose-6-phosphate isomerase [Leptospira ognonensis]|uniref:Mannose-6-phosphate isomerase n=1 Tax=Leptospira ognonensis TaxID=2484945 RepID=A0A4R9JWX6_9LEPT|nr:type I phosphomannose isomerase catalytic subunit [Leptospira ognonensis]TGL56510.1 mannose-6-phosphate isomerase [Leptospira ognonensis]
MNPFPNIIKFEPIYKEKIWGGNKFKSDYQRKTPSGLIGESWEISDYGSEISKFTRNETNTEFNFRELYQNHTESFLGKSFLNQSFPLLIKMIDAQDKLSVQVHPDDAYAEKYDPSSAGKKECWLVLSAEPDAELVIGFSRDTSRGEYERLVQENKAEEMLKKWKVKPGDVFLLNPGTIHAIGAGVVLLEVQQSSDSTYRVYDYGRLGDDGRPRDLHLEKALSVLNFKESDSSEKQNARLLSDSPFPRYVHTSNDKFRLELWDLKQAQNISLAPFSDPVSFGIIHIVSGSIDHPATGKHYVKGDTLFLTAAAHASNEIIFASPKTKLAYMGAGTDWVRWI